MKNPERSTRVAASSASLFAALLVALPVTLNAQTWTGGTNTSWGNAGNWTPGTPAFNDTTDILFDTSAVTNPATHLFANRTVRSLTFGADVDAAMSIRLSQFIEDNVARALTFQADSGNASININAGATGEVNIGVATAGSIILGSHLDIVHNGTGTLLFSRPTTGNGHNITLSGTGTWQVNNNLNSPGALNLNGGTMIANTSGVGDLNTAAALNLGGGTLEIRSGGGDKNYNTVGLTVSSASTLVWNNQNSVTRTLQFSGAGNFILNDDLTVRNSSAETSLVNAFTIGRAITGDGRLIVETYNDISSSAGNYGLGRVLLNGDNSGWSGDLVIARGTVNLAGAFANGNASGTGTIEIGTTADSFGAGLTFFSTLPNASTVTYGNDIIVRSGGFRSIKGGNTDHGYAFTGDVTLEGTLNIDHTMSSTRAISFSGDISGVGGIAVTRVAGSAETTAVLSGVNTYTGATSVATGASLLLNGSLTSNVSVASDARFGGNGSTSGQVDFADGALFIFSPTATLTVDGAVSLANSFGIASLVTATGAAIDWSLVAPGVYTLIQNGSDFSNISNFGLANAVDLGGGLSGYFQNGSLQLVIVPEPSSAAVLAGLGVFGFVCLRRRRIA